MVTLIGTQSIVQPRSCAYHSSSSSSSDGGPAIHALQGPSDSAPKAPPAACHSHICCNQNTARQGKHIYRAIQKGRLQASRKDWLHKADQGELSR